MVAQSAILRSPTVCQIDSGQEFREIIKENSEMNSYKVYDFVVLAACFCTEFTL